MRLRSFQGVSDGESAEKFFPSKLKVERRATSAHISISHFNHQLIESCLVVVGGG